MTLAFFYLEQRNLDGEFHQNANRISSVFVGLLHQTGTTGTLLIPIVSDSP